MVERRCPTTDKVQAMIGAGGGANVKSGQSTGAKGATVQVNFGAAFTGVPHITLVAWSAVHVWLVEVTTTYFKWVNDSKGADVTVDWMATDIGG